MRFFLAAAFIMIGLTAGLAGARAQQLTPEEVVARQAQSANKFFAERNFRNTANLVTFRLRNSEQTTHIITLKPGLTYALTAFCDNDCGALELAITDQNGKLLARDNENTDTPVVQWSGTIQIKVTVRTTMKNCSGYRDCAVGLIAFASSRPLPIKPPQGTLKSSGTGVVIAKTGHLLTNYHVIRGCGHVMVAPTKGNPTRADVIAFDPREDLALLKANRLKSANFATFRRDARLGEQVFVFGYPYLGLLSSDGNFTSGHVTALAGINNDGSKLQISAPVQSGNSGGALLDGYGNVLGIVASKLDSIKMFNSTNDLAQNVNFAIKSRVVSEWIAKLAELNPPNAIPQSSLESFIYKPGHTPTTSTTNFTLTFGVATGIAPKSEDIADLAQGISVKVLCYAGDYVGEATASVETPPQTPKDKKPQHVRIGAHLTLLYDGIHFTGLRFKWVFDKSYTAMATEGFDRNHDGIYDPVKLAELAKVNVDGLKEFHYFTQVTANGRELGLGDARDYWLEHKDGKLALYFTLPLAAGLPLDARDVDISLNDSNAYISFEWLPAVGVKFGDKVSAPASCRSTLAGTGRVATARINCQ